MRVRISELEAAVRAALVRFGYDSDEVDEIADVLLYAQLRDNNQGISKLIGAGLPRSPDAGEITTLRETALSVLLDGGQRPGIVVANRAMRLAIGKATESGFGVVGTHNTSSSTGALGYYAGKIARAGHIGLVLSGSPEAVAPCGSHQALFGTNPIAVGIPSPGAPIVFDTATSAIAYYGLVEAAAAGRPIPNDVAFDEDGNPTTDPNRALTGAIRTFDRGPRSSGLALVFEVLTGPLVGAAFAGVGDTKANWGHLVLAIDPGLLGQREAFLDGVALLADQVHGAARLPEVDEIHLPGERGDRLTQRRLAAGALEIEDNLWRELRRVAGTGTP